MAKKIPAGITPEDFMKTRDLLNGVLEALNKAAANGGGPLWVSCRLNETGRNDPSPFFVGWVEDKETRDQRVLRNDPDPGLYRFGDDYYSQIYEECVRKPGVIVAIDEVAQKIVGQKGQMHWISGAKSLSLKAEAKHRRSIAIQVDNRCVGTLNAGFSDDPGTSVNKTMESWAQDSKSQLVQYLKKEFELGGPPRT